MNDETNDPRDESEPTEPILSEEQRRQAVEKIGAALKAKIQRLIGQPITAEMARKIGDEMARMLAPPSIEAEFVPDADSSPDMMKGTLVIRGPEGWLDELCPPEHDPATCGCEYKGNNCWSCGHVDQEAQE